MLLNLETVACPLPVWPPPASSSVLSSRTDAEERCLLMDSTATNVELGRPFPICGGRIMASRRCPCPNPWNMCMCYLTVAKWTLPLWLEFVTLRWRGYPRFSGWGKCHHNVLKGGELFPLVCRERCGVKQGWRDTTLLSWKKEAGAVNQGV